MRSFEEVVASGDAGEIERYVMGYVDKLVADTITLSGGNIRMLMAIQGVTSYTNVERCIQHLARAATGAAG